MKNFICILSLLSTFSVTCMSPQAYMNTYGRYQQSKKQSVPSVANNPYTSNITQISQQPLLQNNIDTSSLDSSLNTLAGTISLDIQYLSTQGFNTLQTTSLFFDQSFTTQDLQDGLIMHFSLFPPSTAAVKTNAYKRPQRQGYFVICMLVSNDGTIVARKELTIPTLTPPTNLLINYDNDPISSTKNLFSPNSKLNDQQNQAFFNKKSPMHKKFYIKKTRFGVVAQ